MKKLLLAAALCIGSFVSANASYVAFLNQTNCSFNFNIDGLIGTTGGFVANGVVIPPGYTMYANPTLLPGVSQSGTGSLASGSVQVVKGYDIGGPYSFVVGILTTMVLPTNYNSASNSYFPVCHGGNAYFVTFSQNGNGDVVVTIL